MQTDEALDIVAEYKQRHGLPGTLEALKAMKVDPNLTARELEGFTTAFAGFQRLFHGPAPTCTTCHGENYTHHPACQANPAYRAGDWN